MNSGRELYNSRPLFMREQQKFTFIVHAMSRDSGEEEEEEEREEKKATWRGGGLAVEDDVWW